MIFYQKKVLICSDSSAKIIQPPGWQAGKIIPETGFFEKGMRKKKNKTNCSLRIVNDSEKYASFLCIFCCFIFYFCFCLCFCWLISKLSIKKSIKKKLIPNQGKGHHLTSSPPHLSPALAIMRPRSVNVSGLTHCCQVTELIWSDKRERWEGEAWQMTSWPVGQLAGRSFDFHTFVAEGLWGCEAGGAGGAGGSGRIVPARPGVIFIYF